MLNVETIRKVRWAHFRDDKRIRQIAREFMLKSLLGFRGYIHVNCNGLVTEGRYPEDV
jgi:hypothetical protein